MALPSFVAATGHVYINNTPKAVSVPVGTQSGDTLIAFITGEAGSTGAVNYPAGWTQLQRNPADAFRDSFIMVIATSDGSASYNFSTVGPNSAITILSYRGVTAIGNSGIVLYDGTAGSNAATPVLAITGGDVLEVMGCAYVDGRTATITGPAGSTNRVTRNTNPTLNVSDIAVSGSNTTAKNFTLSVSGVKRSAASVLLAGAASGGSTPVSFSGTVNSQSATVGTAFNLNLSSFFAGSLTPFTYSLVAGDLTGTGLSLNTSTGVISGTPTASATLTGLQVRATDTDSNTAQTNTFSITVSAAPQVPQGTFTVGTITVTSSTASVPYTYSASDQTSIQYTLNGGTTTFTASNSPQALSGLTANTTYTIQFRAVNAAGNGAWSTGVQFTTNAATTASFTLIGLANNAGVLWSDTGSITVDVYNPSTGALVIRKTGLSSNTSGDVIVSDAAMASATTYTAVITIGSARGVVSVTTS